MKRWIALIGLLGGVLGAFLLGQLEIYPQARVSLTQESSIQYQPSSSLMPTVQCWQAIQPVPVSLPRQFGVLVWNVHKGADRGWGEALSRYAQPASLLLLQEVTNEQPLAKWLPSAFESFLSARGFAFLGRESGVMTVAKGAPQRYCAGSEVEPWIRVPKVGVSAHYPLANGQSLLVVNLHLVNFEWNPHNYRAQLSQAIEQIAQHQGPIILAGDFNTWNRARLALLRQLTATYGLTEAQFSPDVRLRVFGNALDHILVRDLTILSAKSEPTTSSDHNPLFLQLEIQ